ncbi:MAG: transcriptional regulator [Acidimicrobiaceae bacterium]|nr:transcriptional regulator [Acidimicrobiaceae bacterium]MBJ32310.1 transcriptional regulator [Acidimicrobiaceae bacterium]
MRHPLLDAVAPLIDAIGGEVVTEEDAVEGGVPLEWDGSIVAIVRLPDLNGALARQVALVEAEIGETLSSSSSEEKHKAVRLLEERGAFTVRKSVEQVAEALGVSRFTIYNYLNASRAKDGDAADNEVT